MKFRKELFLIPALIVLIVSVALSKPHRVTQIPNGSKFGCINCHVSTSGGDLNLFGKTVHDGYLNNGNVNWGTALANIDSDVDGFTNGRELQDENGEWAVGQADPGSMPLVTLPGDPDSKPEPDGVDDMSNLITVNAFPNPFINELNISIALQNDVNLSVRVYTAFGRLIGAIHEGALIAGNNNLSWAGIDDNGSPLANGTYIIKIEGDGVSYTQLVKLLK